MGFVFFFFSFSHLNDSHGKILINSIVFSDFFFFVIGFIIPQRVVSALMAFSAVALAYMLRISLSYAITQMVTAPHAHENGSIIENPDICPPYEDELIAIDKDEPIPTIISMTTDKYYWSQELQGLILSAFYWGYILTHVPGGLLSAKIGGKYTLLLGVAIATIFTLFTPLAIRNGLYFALTVHRITFIMFLFLLFNYDD